MNQMMAEICPQPKATEVIQWCCELKTMLQRPRVPALALGWVWSSVPAWGQGSCGYTTFCVLLWWAWYQRQMQHLTLVFTSPFQVESRLLVCDA